MPIYRCSSWFLPGFIRAGLPGLQWDPRENKSLSLTIVTGIGVGSSLERNHHENGGEKGVATSVIGLGYLRCELLPSTRKRAEKLKTTIQYPRTLKRERRGNLRDRTRLPPIEKGVATSVIGLGYLRCELLPSTRKRAEKLKTTIQYPRTLKRERRGNLRDRTRLPRCELLPSTRKRERNSRLQYNTRTLRERRGNLVIGLGYLRCELLPSTRKRAEKLKTTIQYPRTLKRERRGNLRDRTRLPPIEKGVATSVIGLGYLRCELLPSTRKRAEKLKTTIQYPRTLKRERRGNLRDRTRLPPM
ncbi:hypothetical protein J6590_062160 [Homalodisca vitripennis]|nr:hypothetical protein J6590_062160 [Homalodisca vitripennis]